MWKICVSRLATEQYGGVNHARMVPSVKGMRAACKRKQSHRPAYSDCCREFRHTDQVMRERSWREVVKKTRGRPKGGDRPKNQWGSKNIG